VAVFDVPLSGERGDERVERVLAAPEFLADLRRVAKHGNPARAQSISTGVTTHGGHSKSLVSLCTSEQAVGPV
jgi:hypothetical protein